MTNRFLRPKSRIQSRGLSARRRRAASSRLRSEQLEARTMLAGDVVNAFHNAAMPADVSGDGSVTLNDALLLVSELRETGPRSLLGGRLGSGGEGEGGGQLFLDVNGDEMLTLGDAFGVVSDLRSEGEGIANDDFFDVNENSANNQLNVLTNDQRDVGDVLSINKILLSVNGALVEEANTGTTIESDPGSSFSITGDRQNISYTPRPGFFGEERVTYELNDGNGNLTLATATIEVSPVNAAIRYRLETTTVGGTPITEIDQGETFVLNVFVQDIRSDLNDTAIQGLEQGFLDVAFDTAFVSMVGSSVNDLTFGSDFTEFESATITAGEIGEVGAARNFTGTPPLPPLGNGEVLLFSAQFTADNVTPVSGPGAIFDGNHPEDPFSQTLVTNPTGGENIFTPGSTPVEDFLVLEFVDATLTINPGGFAMSDTDTVIEDSANNVIDVLANDTIFPGAMLAIVDVSDPPNGTASINNAGTPGDTTDDFIDYTPDPDFAGVDSFTYTASDGLGGTDMATVTITVDDVNDDPTAVNDSFNVLFDSGQQQLDVLANDSTAPDSPALEDLTVTSVSPTSNGGTVSVTPGGGSVLYTPPSGQFNTDSFTYTVVDDRGGSATATVTVNGQAFDDVITVRLEPSESVVEEGDIVTVTAFIQDVRLDLPEQDRGVFNMFFDLTFDPSIFAPVAGSDGNIADFTGNYEALAQPDVNPGEIDEVGGFFTNINTTAGAGELFFFSIDFLAVGSGVATFATNPADDLGNDTTVSTASPSAPDPTVDPADIDFGTTEVTVNPPVFDTDVVVTVQAIDPDTGTPLTVTSVGDVFEIRVSVRDTRTTTPTPGLFPAVAAAYIDLLIAELGDAVELVPNSFESGPNYGQSPLEGTPIDAYGIDDVGDAIDFSTVTGDPTFDGNQNQLVFSLDFQATGLGEVIFQSATSGSSDNTIVTLDPVEEVPLNEITFGSATVFIADANAPTAIGDVYATFEDTTLTVPAASGVLANDTDPTNDSLTASLQTSTTNGTLTFNTDGSFTYVPNAGFVGSDTFTYRAIDSTGLQSNTAIARINVTAASELMANDDMFAIPSGTASFDPGGTGVLANDVGIGISVTDLVSGPSNGSVTLDADGTFVYVPDTGFTGIDVFTYEITDSSSGTDTARVAIGVGLEAGSVSGRVYFDNDIDGTYEPNAGELAIGNAEVTIIGSNPAIGEFYRRTFSTSGDGIYGLSTVLPGNYSIVETFPEFLLSGTHTTNGVVTVNVAAGITSFTAFDSLTAGEDTVVNFGHMGIHPDFADIRDRFGSTPTSGMIIANDADGDQLWYAKIGGWDSIINPMISVAEDGLTAELTVQNGSTQSFTLPLIGSSDFRVMGTRAGEGQIIRVEGTMADALAEGEFDPDTLDALFAEGLD